MTGKIEKDDNSKEGRAGSGSNAVVPGISDANELSDGEEIREEDKQNQTGSSGQDEEAEFKNLIFQGVPNSSIRHRRYSHNAISNEVGNDEREDQVNWLRKMNPQESFHGWKKEFGQAFKKISKLTSRRNTRDSLGRATKSPQPVANEEDAYTRSLASDLIDTLISGCPAALFASCMFLRDEHGVRRAPLLLAMLGVKVTPLTNSDTALFSGTSRQSSEHTDSSSLLDSVEVQKFDTKYKVELEYGVGYNRLKWVVIKSYKDLVSLHAKLKLVSFQQNTINKLYIDHNRFQRIHLPHFPRFDDHIKVARNSENGEKHHQRESNGNVSPGRPNTLDLQEDTDTLPSPRSSVQFEVKKFRMKHLEDLLEDQNNFSQPMHLRLERYLKLLNLALSLRPQSNRLFQFYELSPIGYLLSYENGFQGKQGYMVVRSTAKSQGWRVSHFKFNDFRAMIERHTNKWFLVRHSYIMYVSDLYSTTPLDVFMVDSKFKIRTSGEFDGNIDEMKEFDPLNDNSKKLSTNLLITLENSERKLQMIVKSEYVWKLWVNSISQMVKSTIWSQPKRFDSFAPVRQNCFCKFLVDGRDYFWALSEALSMAQDVIFIHDWWLSPELYMRRPVKGNQQHRIDRILKERAEKGVKIFIVVYRNVGTTVGTDSSWTKHSMLSLHPNIHLIRSPNQWLQNTYFWAHHEKMTVIDHSIAFMGGIDLCYGRYDTPQHVLRDDKSNLQDQIFPGKDYSNARICDFYDLDKPFESMYDRTVVPRMPWHDVHMMTVGEPARDMSRHFVQRWNYLLRQKRPSRPTPLLTPPSDFTPEELANSPFFRSLKNRSTCEVQVLRSTGNWSLGLKETEKSIQNAYLKLIETSQHYIYIENQFFVTSSSWDGVVVENKIGDALVDRIIKANCEGKPWKAFIIIPLMPGFDSQVDQPEGSSVRVIMQCQYQSISRGDTSIFARLKKLDINPLQYIQFFSLRKWSTIGPNDKLVTEQLYVHGKVLLVDDRSCIIGSANVNERSMLGNRDSEVAALIRDTDLVKSQMDGKPYMAGRFAWELRQRLMREHLGCDVDIVEIVERIFGRLEQISQLNYKTLSTLTDDGEDKKSKIVSAFIEMGYREVMDVEASDKWKTKYGSTVKNFGIKEELDSTLNDELPEHLKNTDGKKKLMLPNRSHKPSYIDHYHSFNNRAGEANIGIRDKKPISTDSRLVNNEKHIEDVEGLGPDGWKETTTNLKENVTQQLRSWAETIFAMGTAQKKKHRTMPSFLPNREDVEAYLDESQVDDIDKWDMLKRISYLQHLSYKNKNKCEFAASNESKKSSISSTSCNSGDASKKFGQESNSSHAAHANILEEQELDDDLIDEMMLQLLPPVGNHPSKPKTFLNLNFIDPYAFEDPLTDFFYEDMWFSVALRNTLLFRLVFHCQPDNSIQTWRDYKDFRRMAKDFDDSQDALIKLENPQKNDEDVKPEDVNRLLAKNDPQQDVSPRSEDPTNLGIGVSDDEHPRTTKHQVELPAGSERKSKSAALKMKLSSSVLYGANQRLFDKHTAQRLLSRIHGHLVIFPTDWLAKELESKNWFYSADRLPPIDIYD